jgi:uncharacterized protein (DUF2147 family)
MFPFRIFIIFLLLYVPQGTFAAEQEDEILGIWKTEKKDAMIEVTRCGENICGDVVWIQEDGSAKDTKNPDPGMRGRPILGLRIMSDFKYAGQNRWKGHLYDPDNGKTYKGEIRLSGHDRLSLRGYVGTPVFGRTSVWTRAEAFEESGTQ